MIYGISDIISPNNSHIVVISQEVAAPEETIAGNVFHREGIATTGDMEVGDRVGIIMVTIGDDTKE